MIVNLIGAKRALFLGILIAVNLAIAAIFFLWLEPMRGNAVQQVGSLKGQISSLQRKIQDVKKEVADYHQNLPKYEEMQKSGFFNGQDRFQLARDLDRIKDVSGVGGFAYSVTEISDVPNKDIDAAKMRLLISTIDISRVQSMTDVDFYKLIDTMSQSFPAHIRLQAFAITRGTNLDAAALEKIRLHQNVSLLNTAASFDWVTISPDIGAANEAATPGKGG
jgi:hypothetical protein